jgi:hypothetical protein
VHLLETEAKPVSSNKKPAGMRSGQDGDKNQQLAELGELREHGRRQLGPAPSQPEGCPMPWPAERHSRSRNALNLVQTLVSDGQSVSALSWSTCQVEAENPCGTGRSTGALEDPEL